jgi:hypothetical protein
MQVSFESGLLVLSTHNVNLAFTDRVIHETLEKYKMILAKISGILEKGTLEKELKVSTLEPLFKVR